MRGRVQWHRMCPSTVAHMHVQTRSLIETVIAMSQSFAAEIETKICIESYLNWRHGQRGPSYASRSSGHASQGVHCLDASPKGNLT